MIDNFLRAPRWPAEILAAVLRVLGAVTVLYALMVKGRTIQTLTGCIVYPTPNGPVTIPLDSRPQLDSSF